MYTNHSAIKYLVEKSDAKPGLFCWVLLLQEFDYKISDKKMIKNVVADNLFRLEFPKKQVEVESPY